MTEGPGVSLGHFPMHHPLRQCTILYAMMHHPLPHGAESAMPSPQGTSACSSTHLLIGVTGTTTPPATTDRKQSRLRQTETANKDASGNHRPQTKTQMGNADADADADGDGDGDGDVNLSRLATSARPVALAVEGRLYRHPVSTVPWQAPPQSAASGNETPDALPPHPPSPASLVSSDRALRLSANLQEALSGEPAACLKRPRQVSRQGWTQAQSRRAICGRNGKTERLSARETEEDAT
eukprot:scaffold48_cov311-Pinguiococcus_pyrenoidosus.AAC.206